MIKLKDLLYEMSSLNLLIPRKLEGRMEKYIQLKIIAYEKNNNVGDFDISRLGLTELPASLKDLKIGGTFFCYNNSLTSLAGAPVSVGGNFDCSTNKLTSLAGAPTSIGGHFYCSTNSLTSLVDGPVTVGGSFFCNNNSLTSLAGAPSSVGLEFMCNNNKLTSLAGAPSSVGGYFYCYGNSVKFTEEQVRAVCDVKGKIFV